MRRALAVSTLMLAILAQLGVALIAVQSLADGLVLADLLTLLHDPATLTALAAAAAAAILGALILAVAAWRRSAFWLGPLLLPLLWPVVLRMGPDTELLAITIAHAAIGLSLGAICGVLSLSRLTRNVMRAALLCGVSPFGAVRRVMLPVLAPGLLAGTLLAATVSLLLSFLRAQPDGAVDATMFVGISAAHWWPAGVAVIAVAVVSSCALRLLRD